MKNDGYFNMTNEEYVYQELVKIANKIGFERERMHNNPDRLARAIGDYLNEQDKRLYHNPVLRNQKVKDIRGLRGL